MDAKIKKGSINTSTIKRIKHSREDGYLIELFSKKYRDFKAVHSYLVCIAPGKTRAGHYHKKKTEVIFPVDGEVIITLRKTGGGSVHTSIGHGRNATEIALNGENEDYSGLLISPQLWHLVENRTDKKAKIIVFSDSFDLEDTYI
ncbi:MAG: WxcM-like domain-containing protein [archaeon]